MADLPKVLGLIWDSHADNFLFAVEEVNIGRADLSDHLSLREGKEFKFTKRTLLSKINSIFDPMGFAAPLIVKAKIMMQRIWVHEPKLNWDDKIPVRLITEWVEFFAELSKMNQATFSRCIKPKNINAMNAPNLVIFCDA